MSSTEPLLLTIPEAARVLGISASHAYLLARSGDLPTVRIGRSVRISHRSLAAWCDEQERESAPSGMGRSSHSNAAGRARGSERPASHGRG